AFLGLVAMLSLPAARGAGPVGWMPMWLLGMPLAAFAALALAERFTRTGARAAAEPVAAAASRRRARPAQARRRAPRRGAAGRRPGARPPPERANPRHVAVPGGCASVSVLSHKPEPPNVPDFTHLP